MGEVDDIISLSKDCLTEQLSSSDEDDFTWGSLAPVKCPKLCRAWDRHGDLAKHFEEVDEDVAHYAASQPKWTNRAKLSWRKTKTGRRRARRGGSGGSTRSTGTSSLPAAAEEKASDAFLDNIIGADDPEEFGRLGLDDWRRLYKGSGGCL
eukprot:5451092-Amphidinium_carterae.2